MTATMMVNGKGTRAVETADTQADPTKATIKARGGASTATEATVTVCETSAIAVSAATGLRGVPHRLDVHVRSRALALHPQNHLRPPKTRRSPISRRRACSRPRRTRSRIRTGRAPCSNTMSRLRPASLLLGGGFTFSRVKSKLVRSCSPSFFLPPPSLCLLPNTQFCSIARL